MIHRIRIYWKHLISYTCLTGLLLFAGLVSDSPAAQNSWHYPLEIKAGLSSNFGEFRGNRVHTGVDLRTNGQTGYKVYAIDDGTIVRLAVTRRGFGNALYIQHPNGLMSVYGHLDRFEEQSLGLRTLVKQIQKQRKTKYPGNIFLKKRVKRGQLIAYSGETGVGLPHLHFEVRIGGDAPIDPFEHGFTYTDTTAPIINSVSIEPLGSQSLLDGEHFLREYQAQKKNGGYTFSYPPRVSGQVRFTVATYDQIGAKNRCGVDNVVMWIDGEKYFSNQFDKVTYNTNHRGGLVYDFNFTRLSNPSQYYYRFYTISLAHFPYRQVFAKNNGVWDTTDVTDGLHEVTFEITDAMGNVSRAQMPVMVENTVPTVFAVPEPEHDWYVELREFPGFLEVVCQSKRPLQAPPAVEISRKNNRIAAIVLSPKGDYGFSGTYDLASGDNGVLTLAMTATTLDGENMKEIRQFPVHPISAKRGGKVSYSTEASMSFPPGALYENIFTNIFPTTSYKETKGLPLVSKVFDFRPAGCPLEKRATIRIQYPTEVKDTKKIGIFWWDQIKQRWYFFDDRVESGTRSLKAKIIYPSIYAILEDTIKPVISDLVPAPGSTVSKSRSTLSAIIQDVGKGVDEDSIVMLLDGKRIDGEYDPDRHRVSYSLTKTLSSGTHTLTVQASDNAGHPAASKTSTFFVK